MEFKKDNSSLSRGYEIKNNTLLFGSNSYLGSFLNNESTRILKRTERLATALYLVTECIESSEPLREKIRNSALELVSKSHELLLDAGISRFESDGKVVVLLIELRSLISLGLSVSIVSSMNGTILVTEITTLIQDLEAEKISRLGEFGGMRTHLKHKEISLTKEMFEIGDGEIVQKSPVQNLSQGMSLRKEIERNSDVSYKGQQNIQPVSKGHMPTVAQHTRPISQSKVQPSESGGSKSDIAIRLGRRNTILKLIKDMREVTIKEVSNVVPDVSEKTIQRELLNLVSEGVLKKTGEKRWSRYSLKT
ncbi:MAG: DeoR family transcriptional regulator [Candidatus Pacebacteria bacterium]|nr:DeoR family transcriptional regulator [Candidatus Paceibacterota bacterium]MBP9780673.1 DeoR family transcriptional regulator [Candidatus Paceibacterota bacterium]